MRRKIIPASFFFILAELFNLLLPSFATTKRFPNLHFYFSKMMLAQAGIKVNLRFVVEIVGEGKFVTMKKKEQLEILWHWLNLICKLTAVEYFYSFSFPAECDIYRTFFCLLYFSVSCTTRKKRSASQREIFHIFSTKRQQRNLN